MATSKASNLPSPTAGFWNIYFLGISVVFASLLISWTDGFERYFWEYIISTAIISTAYLSLMLCLAEMSSILPFGGGAYGFARVTTGPFLGYLVGCFESFGNIMFVAVAVVPMGECITFMADAPVEYEPLYWLGIYCLSLIILIYGGKYFFSFTTALGICTLMLAVLYLLGTIPQMDFSRYVTAEEDSNGRLFADGVTGLLYVMPISSWFYVGIDVLPLLCSDAINAQKTIPRAIMACMVTMLVFVFGILFAAPSQSPGVGGLYNAEDGLPLNSGYSQLFGISYRAVTSLSMPGLFVSNYAFMYAYGKQIYAMSRSKLLPTALSGTYGDIHTPHVSLVVGGIIGYVIMLIIWFVTPNLLHSLNYIYNACQMGSFVVYLTMFASFIIFRKKYYNLERHFVNPLGVWGAVYGIIVFLFSFIGLIFFQSDHYVAVIIFIIFVALCTVYYFAYAQEHQCFSPEEQHILFIVYVMKANHRRRLFSRFHQHKPDTPHSIATRSKDSDSGQAAAESSGSFSVHMESQRTKHADTPHGDDGATVALYGDRGAQQPETEDFDYHDGNVSKEGSLLRSTIKGKPTPISVDNKQSFLTRYSSYFMKVEPDVEDAVNAFEQDILKMALAKRSFSGLGSTRSLHDTDSRDRQKHMTQKHVLVLPKNNLQRSFGDSVSHSSSAVSLRGLLNQEFVEQNDRERKPSRPKVSYASHNTVHEEVCSSSSKSEQEVAGDNRGAVSSVPMKPADETGSTVYKTEDGVIVLKPTANSSAV